MKTKKKKNPALKLPAITSNEELHASVDRIAELEVKQRELESLRDAAIQEVQRVHDGPIEAIKAEITALAKLCGIYSGSNRKGVFGSLKSAATNLATYGFRSGTDALKILSSKWSWEKVLEKLKEKGRTEFIRTKEEIDKEAIKNANLTDAELAELGMRLDQGEKFFIESKAPGADRIATAA